MVAKDIMIDEYNELVFKDGDFEVRYSDGQHVKLILMSEKGSWRQEPLTGIGLRKMLNTKMNSIDRMVLKKQLTLQLQNDGYKVNAISMPNTKSIKIDYERI